jgi:soluble lytic murein transglycosylase
LYSAEVVSRRLPSELPHQFLPEPFRQLLYPRPYEFQVEQQARRFGVDPDLLTAIIREESRFDPLAISGASARGLTQFVGPTARRLAQKLDWVDLDPADLLEPEVAITLGAAYLAELADRFKGNTGQVVAAYNAGEDLARLWQAYCFSQESEEYFSKVGFRQTRGYLEKVLTSRAHYAEIYPEDAGP